MSGETARVPGTLRIRGATPLAGQLRAPGDKSISHRALLIGALGEGTSVIDGLSEGDDVRRTLSAIRALGAQVTGGAGGAGGADGAGGAGGAVTITGGRGRLHAPSAPIDCANSGTSMRLVAGVAAGIAGRTDLVGDASLSARPMDRIAVPLRLMGAGVAGSGDRCTPPITVTGGPLHAISYSPPVASAQVKSAILLAALCASGETEVREPVRTRAHTEELLARAGAAITVVDSGTGRTVRVGTSKLEPIELVVPGDPSQAAFWIVAACVVEGSCVTVEGIYAGAERIGYLGVLARMGARLEVARHPGDVADVTARAGPLTSTTVEAGEIPSLDEVPALAVAAACASGTTRFVGMDELRVKETDRLEAVSEIVRAYGASAEIDGDDLLVHGTRRSGAPWAGLRPFSVHSRGDHRIAMAAAVAALCVGDSFGDAESLVEGFGCVETSYPGFLDDLWRLGGQARTPLVAIDGPAGSGKSTVSRTLARRLGIARLDTGAMYRAIAWAAIDRAVDPADSDSVAQIARSAEIVIGSESITIDGTDVTGEIRAPAVNHAVSVVAANPGVRAALVERQRAWAGAHRGGVVEGRDIGTVVFPDADLKVYLTASPEERVRRRHDEAAGGVARRDRIDSTRSVSPMARAHDARLVDTTGRSVDAVVGEILSWL